MFFFRKRCCSVFYVPRWRHRCRRMWLVAVVCLDRSCNPISLHSSHSGVTSSESLLLSNISDVTASTRDYTFQDSFTSSHREQASNGRSFHAAGVRAANFGGFKENDGRYNRYLHCSEWPHRNGRASNKERDGHSMKERVTLLTSLWPFHSTSLTLLVHNNKVNCVSVAPLHYACH